MKETCGSTDTFLSHRDSAGERSGSLRLIDLGQISSRGLTGSEWVSRVRNNGFVVESLWNAQQWHSPEELFEPALQLEEGLPRHIIIVTCDWRSTSGANLTTGDIQAVANRLNLGRPTPEDAFLVLESLVEEEIRGMESKKIRLHALCQFEGYGLVLSIFGRKLIVTRDWPGHAWNQDGGNRNGFIFLSSLEMNSEGNDPCNVQKNGENLLTKV